jgi:hypothetical protein
MKKRIVTMAAGLLMGGAGWCAAQYPEDVPEAEIETAREPIYASLMLRTCEISDGEDALQHRADYDDATRQHWQNGKDQGGGWGGTLSVKQGPSELTLRRERLEHDFEARSRDDYQTIETTRDDWELQYWHTQEGQAEFGEEGGWGWTVGIRHVASRKEMEIGEKATVLATDGDVAWNLAQGGYWGAWRPLQWRTRLFGVVNFLFGEVDGLARFGNDTKLDGKIEDTYRHDSGLAYGMNFTLGVGIDLLKYARIDLGYRREWLYSFQATDSGVVVFPDNDDALFIENIAGLYAEAGVRFRF